VQQKFLNDDDIGIACVYFNHKEDISPVDIIGSVLKQLVQRKQSVSEEIQDLHRKHLNRETRPSLVELSELLQLESRSFSKVFVILDALDECPESNNTRSKILRELQKLQPMMQLMVTGRPVVSNLMSIFTDLTNLEIRALDSDIAKFVAGQVEIDENLRNYTQRDKDLKAIIVDTIVSNAKGM
jgi:hypothetical protein